METVVVDSAAPEIRPVRVLAAALAGVGARLVEIEASTSGNAQSPPRILGLPDAAVREAYHRVRAAFDSLNLSFPRGRVVVNLAPACTRKAGSGFDLGIALALACLSGFLPRSSLRGSLLVGELGLDGSVRRVPGILSMAELARDLGIPRLLCPEDCAALAARACDDVQVLPIATLDEALGICRHGPAIARPIPSPLVASPRATAPDLSRVRGQESARRALIIAAAGGHNLAMSGPPGCGKTLLARCLPGLLPPLTEAERLEVARIRGAFGTDGSDEWTVLEHGLPPFRAPHHTVSYAGLVGGGRPVQPGEVTLAHRGVLFLDELPEFQRTSLEALRQPLEAGSLHVRRATESVKLPARFQLVVAMNPCPCGHLGHPRVACTCTPRQIARYRERISGPLLDRIDLHLELRPTPADALLGSDAGTPDSDGARAIVMKARERQRRRNGGLLNAELEETALRGRAHLDAGVRGAVLAYCRDGRLSARAITRVLRVARSIADLKGHEGIEHEDLTEALHYRLR